MAKAVPLRLTKETKILLASTERIAAELTAHARLDDERHAENKQTLAEISEDVKSLLESRSFARGIWKAAVVAGGIAGACITYIITLIKG